MKNKTPNKFFAPIVIAGITIGFLASAYKFIFADKNRTEIKQPKFAPQNVEKEHEKNV